MVLAVSAFTCTEDLGSEHELGWQCLKARALNNNEVYLFTAGYVNSDIHEQLDRHNLRNVVVHTVDFPKSVDAFLNATIGKGHLLTAYAWEFLLFFYMLRRFGKNQFDVGVKSTYAGYRWPSFLWYFSKQLHLDPVSGGGGFPLRFRTFLSAKAQRRELFRMFMQRVFYFDPFVFLTMLKAGELHVSNAGTKAMTPKFFRKKCVLKNDFIKVDASDFKMEEARKTVSVDPDILKIFHTGKLLEWKGVMIILRALALLPNSVKYEYTVMGSMSARQYYLDYVLQEGLNVTFVDPEKVPRHDLSFYFFAHDLFTFAALHGDGGHAPVEAKMHGMRLLTLDFSGLEQTLTKDDICIQTEALNEREIVQQIAESIEHLYYELKCPPSSVASSTSQHTTPAAELERNYSANSQS